MGPLIYFSGGKSHLAFKNDNEMLTTQSIIAESQGAGSPLAPTRPWGAVMALRAPPPAVGPHGPTAPSSHSVCATARTPLPVGMLCHREQGGPRSQNAELKDEVCRTSGMLVPRRWGQTEVEDSCISSPHCAKHWWMLEPGPTRPMSTRAAHPAVHPHPEHRAELWGHWDPLVANHSENHGGRIRAAFLSRRASAPCKGAGILISHLLCITDSYLIVKGPNSPLQCHTKKPNRSAWSSEPKCEMKDFS